MPVFSFDRCPLLLIDGIGPFFRHYRKKRINWSKIPFSHIETEAGIKEAYLQSVPEDFQRFITAVAAMGYNAVSLDDLAHLVPDPDYHPCLNARINAYRELYRQLFVIAEQAGMSIFITTDVMSMNRALQKRFRGRRRGAYAYMAHCVDQLFRDFPQISGIITRFGETDGLDVEGDFRSELLLRHAGDAREFLRTVLPAFEKHRRLLIFRTWSLGVGRIGDLIWNRNTYSRVFSSIDSPSLVISMKYGETDFFRYLPVNKQFFRSQHKTLVEFQARREYEGFGAYPSFFGWECERYIQELVADGNLKRSHLIGASVWCQTGGWGKRRQLTFIRNSSVWVELNTYVIAHIVKGQSCQQAIDAFCEDYHQPALAKEPFRDFLTRSERVIADLLYMRELAERKLFFRRLRMPPQLFVFWDRVVINHHLKRFLNIMISDTEACRQQGWDALDDLHRMIELAEEHALPMKGLRFQLETFTILALARDYFFLPFSPEIRDKLEVHRQTYMEKYRRHYSIDLNFDRSRLPSAYMRWLARLLFRDKRGYRWMDRIVTLRLLAWGYPLVRRFQRRFLPKFAQTQAMGLDVLFK